MHRSEKGQIAEFEIVVQIGAALRHGIAPQERIAEMRLRGSMRPAACGSAVQIVAPEARKRDENSAEVEMPLVEILLARTAENHLEKLALFENDLAGKALLVSHLASLALFENHLAGRVLPGSHLAEIALFESHLAGRVLSGSHLVETALFENHLAGIVLSDSHLAETALLELRPKASKCQ
jgi:hypothetical protein